MQTLNSELDCGHTSSQHKAVAEARDRSRRKAAELPWACIGTAPRGDGSALADRKRVPACVGWAYRSTPWTGKADGAAGTDTHKVAAVAAAAGIEPRDALAPDGHNWHNDERGAARIRRGRGLHS